MNPDKSHKLHAIRDGIILRFSYVRHSPELTMWLKERGFKMNQRNPLKDAQKWSELDALHNADKLIPEV